MLWLVRFPLCVAVAAVMLTGCTPTPHPVASGPTPPPADASKATVDAPSPTELAAYAASHQYPANAPSNELRVAAIVNSERSSIKIYNFTNNPLSEIDVWVNGSWMQHVRGIGANASVVIKTFDLYNHFGKNFAGQSEPVSRIQIQTADGFFNAMGPISE